MQISINNTSIFFSASVFKPFLLVGVAGISSVALYTPLSSQTKEIKSKIDSSLLKHLSPFSKTLLTGTEKLFDKLGDWAKIGANTADKIKKLSSEIAKGNVPNGAKHIYVTLNEWIIKIYEFLKTLIDKKVWEKFKSNIQHLSNFLNLFKNIMKAEINGNSSIISSLIDAAGNKGFDEFINNMGELSNKQPELVGNLNDNDLGDLMHALKEDPEKTNKIMKELANKEQGQTATREELMNSIKPAALMGRIKEALAKAKEFEAKEKLDSEEEKQKAKKVFEELGELSKQLTELIQKAKPSK